MFTRKSCFFCLAIKLKIRHILFVIKKTFRLRSKAKGRIFGRVHLNQHQRRRERFAGSMSRYLTFFRKQNTTLCSRRNRFYRATVVNVRSKTRRRTMFVNMQRVMENLFSFICKVKRRSSNNLLHSHECVLYKVMIQFLFIVRVERPKIPFKLELFSFSF